MDTGGSANEQGWSPTDWAASDSTCIHLKEERGREGDQVGVCVCVCVCAWRRSLGWRDKLSKGRFHNEATILPHNGMQITVKRFRPH